MTLENLQAGFINLTPQEREAFLVFVKTQTAQDNSLSQSWKSALEQRWEEIISGKVMPVSITEVAADIRKAFGFESKLPS